MAPGDQARAPYVDALRAYVDRGNLRLNVPGHKGGAAEGLLAELFPADLLAFDVPPLLATIDRGPAPTPMDASLRLAAQAWGARRTWFLTNGASQGNQLACLALRRLGEHVLVQRSVHSSVLDGIMLAGLCPRYVAPTFDPDFGVAHGVSPGELAARLAEHPQTAAVYVVSPSYFGAVADVAGLAEVAHAAGAALVVDEAWGSHLGFHPGLPPNALSQGADVVISSTHKLVGSLTQSAMIHLGEGPFADTLGPAIDAALGVLQSTSASSLLYASLDLARRWIATDGQGRLGAALALATEYRRAVGSIDGVEVADEVFLRHPDVAAIDPLRIVIDVRGTGHTGYEAGRHLGHVDGIDFEVVNHAALVAVLGAGESPADGVDRLVAALAGLRLPPQARSPDPLPREPPWGVAEMTPREAFLSPAEPVPVGRAVGRVAAAGLAAYPPGIPNLVPGERITPGVLDYLRDCVARGGHVRGALVDDLSLLSVVAKA